MASFPLQRASPGKRTCQHIAACCWCGCKCCQSWKAEVTGFMRWLINRSSCQWSDASLCPDRCSSRVEVKAKDGEATYKKYKKAETKAYCLMGLAYIHFRAPENFKRHRFHVGLHSVTTDKICARKESSCLSGSNKSGRCTCRPTEATTFIVILFSSSPVQFFYMAHRFVYEIIIIKQQ